jgi:hypothetical protein
MPLLSSAFLVALLWAQHVPMTCTPAGACQMDGTPTLTVVANFESWELCQDAQQRWTQAAHVGLLARYHPQVGEPFQMIDTLYRCEEPGDEPPRVQGLTFTFPPKRPS